MHRLTQGRRVREEQFHLTLAFLAAVDEQDLEQLLSPPQEIFRPAFPMTLDHWGWWTRKQVGWVAPSVVPTALRQLADNLQNWLRNSGFDLEARPFAAHVTLVRQGHSVVLPKLSAPIYWHVGEFSLVKSLLAPEGSYYNVLGSWPLQ